MDDSRRLIFEKQFNIIRKACKTTGVEIQVTEAMANGIRDKISLFDNKIDRYNSVLLGELFR